jgi:epoxyqueuosine reductase
VLTSAQVKELAAESGFDCCGITTARPAEHAGYFVEWIGEGRHGDMAWMERDPGRRTDPGRVLEGARSVVVVGLNYYQPAPPGRGRMATYALGRDYHDLILARLENMAKVLSAAGGRQRCYVDTGAVLEKPLGARAGVGWQAKSTMLVHECLGTWLFLGEILTTLDLEPDQPARDRCGSCTRCITACPTGAITSPYRLDARRCIAYLTIEHKGAIPLEWRRAIGDRVYGCDECLEVCPWNRWAKQTAEAHFVPVSYPDLRETLAWSEADFARVFAGSPVARLKLRRWLRNVCVVLGNIGTRADHEALGRVAAGSDPMVSEHAEWAISEIEARASRR